MFPHPTNWRHHHRCLSLRTSLSSLHCSLFLAQFLKLFTTWFKEKKWDSKGMVGSGGMPSSHSATVSALATSIGLQQGTRGSTFALAVVLSAVLLNQIVCELPPEHPLSNARPLHELLGHTPPQVAVCAVLGCIVSYIMRISS